MRQYLQEVHILTHDNHVIISLSSGDVPSASSKSSDTPSVGSVSGGGRYDELVGMFDTKGRKVCIISSYIIY